MKAIANIPTQKILKGLCLALCSMLLWVLYAAIAHAGSNGKVILDPEERLWLTENQSRIVLAVETTYPPFVFIDSNDQPTGLAQDYMLLLESMLGVHFKQRRFSSLDDIFEKVRNGEVQIVNAVTKTPSRSTFLTFTKPFVSVPNAIIVRKEFKGPMREEDLSGLRVSLVKSYAITEHFTGNGLSFLPDLVPDDLSALLNVSFGRSDAAVIDLATASYMISHKGINNLRVAGEATFDIQLAIGTPTDEPVLHAIIQKGLDAITDEERRAIRERWINISSSSILSDRRFWGVVGSVLSVVLAVIIGMLIWNRTLRQQVALRTEALNTEKEALRKSEERYRSLVENQTEIVCRFTPDGTLTYVNDAYSHCFNRENLISKKWHFLPVDEDIELFKGKLLELSLAHPTVVIENRIFSGKGEIRWMQFVNTGFFDDHGTLVEVQSVGRDITERKLVEEALRKSEERYRHISNLISDFAFSCVKPAGGDYTIDWLVGPIESITGFSIQEILDKRCWRFLVYPEDMPIFDRNVIGLEPGSSRQCELRIVHKDGSIRWIRAASRVAERSGDLEPHRLLGGCVDITERKQAEEVLRDSEEKFRLAFRTSPDSINLNRVSDGMYLDTNEGFTNIMGYVREEVIGKTSLELSIWEDPKDRVRLVEALKSHGFVENLEARFRGKDGKVRFGLMSARLLCINREEVILSVTRDITERVGQEQEIRLLSRLYAVLSQVSQAVVKATTLEAFLIETCRVIVDEGGFALSWIGQIEPESNAVVPVATWGAASDYVRGITVYADDRPEGRGPTGTCIRERRPSVHNDFLQSPLTQPWSERARPFGICAAAGFPIESEGRAWGALTIYSDKVGFFGDKDVKLLKKVADDIGFALDNLERERQRLRAEQALRASEEKYRNLFENAPIGIFRTNSQGQVLSANHAMAIMLRLTSPHEAVERYSDLGAQLYVDAERRDQFQHLLRQEGHVENFEYEAHAADGGNIWLSMNARVESCDKDGLLAIEGFTTDITERRRAEEEREKLQAQLLQAQKMEAVGRLAGGVAHDFNNMLSIIIGHAEMLLDEIAPDAPFYHDIMEMKNAGQRSADLTRQLLAFARKQTISPKILDLNETASGILKMLRRLIGEDIKISWIPGLDVWPVKIDPGQIDQILANLAVNARDAIGGVGTMTIETANAVLDESYCRIHKGFIPGSYVLLAVSDTGIGMDKETLGRIFEPFFTTKEFGKGTGLGLATIYGIVKQNNGFINVYSEPGHGTTFKIYLPRAEIRVEEKPAQMVKKDLRGTETVLLVEDEESILALGKSILERRGYLVLTAPGPSEALRMAQKYNGPLHLLITDVVMPEMNGKDLKEKLSNIKPGFKCIFMSGYTANVIAHHGVLDEGVDFLQKPFSVKTLAEKVREVLDG